MPDKDLAGLWAILPEPVRAALIGALVAFLRVMYDAREPSILRRLLECALCGSIALCVAYLVNALGANGDFATFAGGAIGLVGADTVREWGRRVAERRIRDLEES
jgi:lambda family phage holin